MAFTGSTTLSQPTPLRFSVSPLSSLKIALISLMIGISPAQGSPFPHEHKPLVLSSTLSYNDVLQAAMLHSPAYQVKQSREEQAQRYQALGSSWLPGNYRFSGNVYDDGIYDNNGATEMEARIDWDLWNWGGRSAASDVANRLGVENTRWQRYQRWMLAGQLRQIMADLRESELAMKQAGEARETAEKLVQIARQRFEAGDVSRDNVLQAESLLLSLKNAEEQAHAAFMDAERNYFFLTGTNQRPQADLTETPQDADEITPDHPMMAWLQSQVDTAGARIQTAKYAARGNPSVFVGTRRERAGQSESYANALSFGVTVPFGGGSSEAVAVSDANRVKSEAQMTFDTAWRDFSQQLHEVAHQRHVLETTLANNQALAEIASERAEMAMVAFREGEITMTEAVLALRESQTLKTEYQMSLAAQQRLIALQNQTLGLLP